MIPMPDTHLIRQLQQDHAARLRRGAGPRRIRRGRRRDRPALTTWSRAIGRLAPER
jgi:hypothetical protein